MFRTIWSKSLRDYRVPILGWGLGLGLLMVAGFATATPALLTAFAAMAPTFAFLGEPVALQTPEGYITFRYLETVAPLMLSFWLILAGSRLLRGEEERGTLDVLLATPRSRVKILLDKVAALLVATLIIGLLVGLGAVAGEASISRPNLGRALLMGLNLALVAAVFGMLALLISQFTVSRSSAVGAASGILVLCLMLTIASRTGTNNAFGRLSPFYYYNLNRPLIQTFVSRPAGSLVLIGVVIFAVLASLVLFARRDIGGVSVTWQRSRTPGRDVARRSLARGERALSSRSVILQGLSAQRTSTAWWLIGSALLMAFCVAISPTVMKPFNDVLQSTPWVAGLFHGNVATTSGMFAGLLVFYMLPAVVIVFALTLALRWAADLENGRLELVLATPQGRPAVVLERFGANLLALLLLLGVTWLVVISTARSIGIDLGSIHLAAAIAGLIPPALVTMALVYALAGRLRYGAVLSIMTLYLVLAYLGETLAGLANVPKGLVSLSIFHLYGNPVLQGIDWRNFIAMTGAGIVLIGVALLQFRAADIARG